MNKRLDDLCEALACWDESAATQRLAVLERAGWLAEADDEEVTRTLGALAEFVAPGDARRYPIVDALVQLLWRRCHHLAGSGPLAANPLARRDQIGLLYRQLPAASQARPWLLAMLSITRHCADLSCFADLLAEDPPTDSTRVVLAFAPLFQKTPLPAASLFPRLLAALEHLSVAACVLDLANFLCREGFVTPHPAAERRSSLAALLGQLAQRLQRLAEGQDAAAAGQSPQQVQQCVTESVSLAVSLCDALAQIGDRSLTGSLYQILALGHRRLRVEAAAALARLGDRFGTDQLLELACEPVVRLRVIAYAEELGVRDRVDPLYQTAAAVAESELALWLSQPTQIGVPPTRLELFDERTLYWPGFDEPVDCFLFRFVYELATGNYSNIAVAGPVTHAVLADLTDLPPEDIYAIFAGWHAEHEEILQWDVNQLTQQREGEVARLERRLRDAGLTGIRPAILGMFFGERVLVAAAFREGLPGIAVTDSCNWFWLPRGNVQRPLQPEDAYCLYKGRMLMRSFNP